MLILSSEHVIWPDCLGDMLWDKSFLGIHDFNQSDENRETASIIGLTNCRSAPAKQKLLDAWKLDFSILSKNLEPSKKKNDVHLIRFVWGSIGEG